MAAARIPVQHTARDYQRHRGSLPSPDACKIWAFRVFMVSASGTECDFASHAIAGTLAKARRIAARRSRLDARRAAGLSIAALRIDALA